MEATKFFKQRQRFLLGNTNHFFRGKSICVFNLVALKRALGFDFFDAIYFLPFKAKLWVHRINRTMLYFSMREKTLLNIGSFWHL